MAPTTGGWGASQEIGAVLFGEEQHDFTVVDVVIKLQFGYRYITRRRSVL
jgi:hypothetical protein